MADAGFGILCIVLVGLLWGGIGVFNSRVGKKGWSIPLYYAVTGFFSLIIISVFVVRWSAVFTGQVSRLSELALVIVPASLVNKAAMMLLLVAMRRGHNGLTWTIGQSAMVVPFIASVGIWGDAAGATGWSGLALTLTALILIGLGKGTGGKEGHSGRWMHIAFLAMALNGIGQTCNTIPSRWQGWTDAANIRPLLMVVVGFIITAVWTAVRRDRPNRELVFTALGASCVGASSSVLLFRGMDLLESAGMLAVAYPLAVGVCIVSFSVYSAAVLKERFGFRGMTATALGVAGIAALAA